MVDEIQRNQLLAKIMITGVMKCHTGLHIGTGGASFEIGGIDSPVVKNPVTGVPYVPGSSLKGKMRSLIERSRPGIKLKETTGKKTRIHWCDTRTEALDCDVCRLFGYLPMDKNQQGNDREENEHIPSSLIIRDMDMLNHEDIAERITSPLKYTEWKSENALDRVSAAANPRQIERVPSGAGFWMEIIYDINEFNKDKIKSDLKTIGEALELLEDSALGGHGSRGYGKVSFHIVSITVRKMDYYSARDKKIPAPIYTSKNPEKNYWKENPQKIQKMEETLAVAEFQNNLGGYVNNIGNYLVLNT